MCAKHQKRIVDDVLTLSKLEYTMLSVSPRPAQLSLLVERSVKMFEQELFSHNITMKMVPDKSLKDNNIDWVFCDESRVQQILINVLTNAIKFTKLESKREITVRYGVTLSDPREAFSDMFWAPSKGMMEDLTNGPEWGLGRPLYLTFMVTDTGVGMTTEEIQRLFNRFEQASERTSIRYGGSGLGLFVSQKLAEKQGGEIGVQSKPSRGSTFACYIKSRTTTQYISIVVGESTRLASPKRSATSPGIGNNYIPDVMKMHVLLVEDNLVNQRVVSRQLSQAGCLVSVANHGVEALEVLRESDIWHEKVPNAKHLDIILMDWEMPIMDGLTCSREIRKLQSVGKLVRHIEILATTANARPEQIQTALDSESPHLRV
jgi:CheY-like chemotaxis protein